MAYRRVWFEHKNRRWFRGRSTRREWWTELFYAFLIGVFATAMGPIAGATIGVWRLVVFWAATARRLHDLNQSAWLQVGMIVCYIGVTLGSLALSTEAVWFREIFRPGSLMVTSVIPVVSSVSAFIFLGFYGWLGFFKGTDGPNAWGEDAPTEW